MTKKTTTTLKEAAETGYLGTPADETPNEAYTMQGQAKGMKTADVKAAEESAAENLPKAAGESRLKADK